jgi:hypothetical protein
MLKIRGANLRRVSRLKRYASFSEVVDVFQNDADAFVLGMCVKDRRKIGIIEQLKLQHALEHATPRAPCRGVPQVSEGTGSFRDELFSLPAPPTT